MIVNQEEQKFRQQNRELFLCENLLSICIPFSWSIENCDEKNSYSHVKFAKNNSDNSILEIDFKIYYGGDFKQENAKQWVQTVIPATTPQNQLELSHDGIERLGPYEWYCATYIWIVDQEPVCVRYKARVDKISKIIQIAGALKPGDGLLVDEVVSSIRILPLSPHWRGL